MKNIEKKQLNQIQGGKKYCMSMGYSTACWYNDGVTSCFGIYTWGGKTESLDCSPA
jgi:bacteriocin-like protein